MKKVISFVLTSFIIGNVIAWFSGAAPIDFPKQAYSKDEQLMLATLKQMYSNTPEDVDVLIELGSQYSLHNDLDEGQRYLAKAIDIAPEDSLAQAWYNANEAKQAGAMLDLSMGLYKLFKLNAALAGISQAVSDSPDDISVRLIRLATFANVGEVNPLFEQVFDDEKWFNALLEKQANRFPDEMLSQFYLSMAKAYLVQDERRDMAKVQYYLSLFQGVPEKKASALEQFSELKADFLSLQADERGAA